MVVLHTVQQKNVTPDPGQRSQITPNYALNNQTKNAICLNPAYKRRSARPPVCRQRVPVTVWLPGWRRISALCLYQISRLQMNAIRRECSEFLLLTYLPLPPTHQRAWDVWLAKIGGEKCGLVSDLV